jgi:hypothetical protein
MSGATVTGTHLCPAQLYLNMIDTRATSFRDYVPWSDGANDVCEKE